MRSVLPNVTLQSRKTTELERFFDTSQVDKTTTEQSYVVQQTFVPFDQMQNQPEPEWLIEGFLPKGYLAILASAPKMGKTCFATALALAVSTGEPFAGLKTRKSTVLWCCLEESSSERALVLRQYKPIKGKTPEFLTTTEILRIDHPRGLDVLYNEIVRHSPGLIVIDPLYAAIGPYSLGENHYARRALTTFKKICGREEITGLVLHHLSAAGKADGQTLRVAESAQLAATASMYMLLSVTSNLPQSNRTIKLESRGRGNSVNQDLYFTSTAPLEYQLTSRPLDGLSDRKAKILQALGTETLNASTIIERTDLNPGTARNLMTELLREGLIEVTWIRSGVRFFRVPSPSKMNES